MKHLFIAVIAFLSLAVTAQKENHVYGGGLVNYQTENRHVTGKYESHYANGNLKAIGYLENGIKIKEWKFFNEQGNLVLSKDFGALSLEKKWSEIKEGDIIWSKRLWRNLPKAENNQILNNNFKHTILNLINDRAVVVYNPSNDEFQEQITEKIKVDDFSSMKLKEDWFLDKTRSMLDVRIIGLTLVDKDGKDIALLYYPEIKQVLLDRKDQNNGIKDLETRNFYSVITKEINLKDKAFDSKEWKDVTEKITIELIEKEIEYLINKR